MRTFSAPVGLLAGSIVAGVMLLSGTAAFAVDAPPSYSHDVLSKISAKVVYPRIAKVRQQEGVVGVAVAVDGSGAIADAHVENSSGVQSLDEAALQATRDAAPFPAPPTPGSVVHGSIKFTTEQ